MIEEQYPARRAFQGELARLAGVDPAQIDPRSLTHVAWALTASRRGGELLGVHLSSVMAQWLNLQVGEDAIDETALRSVEAHLERYREELDAVVARLRFGDGGTS